MRPGVTTDEIDRVVSLGGGADSTRIWCLQRRPLARGWAAVARRNLCSKPTSRCGATTGRLACCGARQAGLASAHAAPSTRPEPAGARRHDRGRRVPQPPQLLQLSEERLHQHQRGPHGPRAWAARMGRFTHGRMQQGVCCMRADRAWAPGRAALWAPTRASRRPSPGLPPRALPPERKVICHGIPDRRELQEGDIVNVDVTAYIGGWHGDLNETFAVGKVRDARAGRARVRRAPSPLSCCMMHAAARSAHYLGVGSDAPKTSRARRASCRALWAAAPKAKHPRTPPDRRRQQEAHKGHPRRADGGDRGLPPRRAVPGHGGHHQPPRDPERVRL